jgi:hypothetical protein
MERGQEYFLVFEKNTMNLSCFSNQPRNLSFGSKRQRQKYLSIFLIKLYIKHDRSELTMSIIFRNGVDLDHLMELQVI